MAEVKDIYGNNAAGKVGTVSFYRLRGKTIMRSLPVNRSKGRTENQLRNQNRFGEIRNFCSLFKKVLIPRIWNGVAITSSGYHLFMKANSAAFDKDGMLANPMKVCLSAGKLALAPGMQAQRTSPEDTSIQVKWDKATLAGGLSAKGSTDGDQCGRWLLLGYYGYGTETLRPWRQLRTARIGIPGYASLPVF